MHRRKYGEHTNVQYAPLSASFVQNIGRQVQTSTRLNAEMTNQCSLSGPGQGMRYGKVHPSNFVQRLVRIPPIKQVIATVAVSYGRMKHVVPQPIRVFIEAVEATVVFILARLISIILALPLPFEAIDAFALQGLDILERSAETIKHAINRLRKLVSRDEKLRNERDYFGMLLRFEEETRKLARGEKRAIVQAFLDTQIGLSDRIDAAIELFYPNEPSRVAVSDREGSEPELTEEGFLSFKQIRRTFEEVMQQKDILTFAEGGPNPLDPVWEYLNVLSTTLTPDEATLQHFSKQIYFMRVVLRTTIEQIKQGAKSSEASSLGAHLESVGRWIHPTWLLQFAIETVTRITGYKVICSVRKAPLTMQHEAVKRSPLQPDTEPVSNSVPAAETAIEITVKQENVPCTQSSEDDAKTVDESGASNVLEIVQVASVENERSPVENERSPVENGENSVENGENSVENGENSVEDDQCIERGPENSSGASGDGNPSELPRSVRRRRKKSGN